MIKQEYKNTLQKKAKIIPIIFAFFGWKVEKKCLIRYDDSDKTLSNGKTGLKMQEKLPLGMQRSGYGKSGKRYGF